ncbi:MAG TPA: hypothetical protein VIL36_18140 [Acidimicrobiales bacterium]
MRRLFSRAAAGVCVAALSIGIGLAQPASAVPFPIENWHTQVTTHIGGGINMDVAIPAGTFSGSVETDTGALTGDLNLPPATFTYNFFFLLPTEVTFQVDPTAPISGNVDLSTGAVTATATFDVRLTSVKLLGLELLDQAQTCKTSTPTTAQLSGTANLSTQPAEVALTGNYAIANLTGCGFWEFIISGVTAGPDNTLNVTIHSS